LPDKIFINSAFWYLGRKYGGQVRLCSHRKVGKIPKYEIMRAIGGGALLDILSEDFKEARETHAFEPMDKDNAITEAMHFAERYEAAYSKS
jgi:hypothetical protein